MDPASAYPYKSQLDTQLVFVLLQDQWLVYGGSIAGVSQSGQNCLYTFDFGTLSWSKADVAGKPLLSRSSYMAAAHEGSMVIMGGGSSINQ